MECFPASSNPEAASANSRKEKHRLYSSPVFPQHMEKRTADEVQLQQEQRAGGCPFSEQKRKAAPMVVNKNRKQRMLCMNSTTKSFLSSSSQVCSLPVLLYWFR